MGSLPALKQIVCVEKGGRMRNGRIWRHRNTTYKPMEEGGGGGGKENIIAL